ncbi:EpsG family protein [Prevotella sp. DNF00663]|uniref:EpsG family protein n=1 Tax=Prevotella sp. DNF00663 TaxID=1384078 RepID=UPI0009EA6809|nr:EpsG family protein [Prevotella sp. DNF00663]
MVYFNSIDRKATVSWLLSVIIILGLIVGLADMLGGYDRYIYCDLFDSCVDMLIDGQSLLLQDNVLMQSDYEFAYVYLNILIAHITDNRYIFVFIVTIIIYTLLFNSFRTYFDDYPMAMVLFLALYFFFTFTYLRQSLAVAFSWFSYRYVIEKRFFPFFICAFLAYKFHNSAIIFFPLYFIPAKKFSRGTILWVVLIAFIIGITGITTKLYGMYGEMTDTVHRVSQYEEAGNDFRIEYVIEVIVFLYFILKRYDKIPSERYHLVFLNSSLVFFTILLLFVKSATAGRQTWYYMLGLIYTLNYITSGKSKTARNYRLMVYIVCTLLFLRIVYSWGEMLNPYKTFLTNGSRENDHIHDSYEYDSNYDRDKFYRLIIHLK